MCVVRKSSRLREKLIYLRRGCGLDFCAEVCRVGLSLTVVIRVEYAEFCVGMSIE